MNASDFMVSLARASAETAVLILLVLGAQRVFRRHLTPQWHCALWLLVSVGLLPFSFSSPVSVFNVLPAWGARDGALPPPSESAYFAAASAQAAKRANAAAPRSEKLVPAAAGGVAPAEVPAAERPRFPQRLSTAFAGIRASPLATLFLVWLAGVVLLGGWALGVSLRFARCVKDRGRTLEDPSTLALLRECGAALGVRRLPRMLERSAVTSPALYGIFRARLLLPPGFVAKFSAAELRFVFLHELAHLRRHDLALNGWMTALQIAHWFNPLVWFAFARWRLDREIACDALALEAAGGGSERDYGRTMLRLLEDFSFGASRPGLVGVLESKRQLERRLRAIAGFAPARKRWVALALVATLAAIGLTDAQVVPPPAAATNISSAATANAIATSPLPPPALPPWISEVRLDGADVLFLVSAAESMLGDTPDEVARWRNAPPAQKSLAPKWRRTASILHSLLFALEPGTRFQVVLGKSGGAHSHAVGIRGARNDAAANATLAEIATRLAAAPPGEEFNLEVLFGFVDLTLNSLNTPRPERVVLLADGLPDRGDNAKSATTETGRVTLFNAAVKKLPPQIPVSTVLLPQRLPEQAAAGLYWELAHATRGALVAPSAPSSVPSHLAFVVDTSGSMRDPNGGGLWPIVARELAAVLETQPSVVGFQVLDGDGQILLGQRGEAPDWQANTPEMRARIARELTRYERDTASNPMRGVERAMGFLQQKRAAGMRPALYILGDEFTGDAIPVLAQLDRLNPRNAAGERAVAIHAIGFPTTLHQTSSLGNTGAKFADLMRALAQEHGGNFVALPEL